MKRKKELPQEVMMEILLRLPVKSLMRFKCVCKQWLSLISDPNFGKQHFEVSMNPSHKIMYSTELLAWSWDFNAPLLNHSALSTIHLPPAFIPPNSVYWMRIVGSCRGFLLIALNDNILLNDLIIWNPTTGSCKKVPPPPTWDNKFVFLCGFGYDASTDDYIIVQISYQNWEANEEDIIFETFSVKSNSWKEVDVRGLNCTYGNLRNDDVDTPRVGSFLNGSIHWLALRMDDQRENPSDSETVIIAFDLNVKSKNTVKDLAVPDDFLAQYSDLGVFGGCLGLIESNEPGLIIYVMKEYGAKSSWVSLIALSLDNIPSQMFSPMFLCKYGEVVGVSDSFGVVKYSDKGGELLEPPNHPIRYERYFKSTAIVYIETLLSLPSNHGDQG